MPEATFLCVDTSEYTRNGDFGGVTRLMGMIDTCNLITGAKLQSNPENTIGFLTMGGRCKVHESLTSDFDRMLASLARVKTEGSLHIVEGLRIGALALAHRANTKGEKRLIAFVASPVTVTQDTLTKLAKKLRKDEIAVDIINVGHEENQSLLNGFIETVNKNSNSHFVQVNPPVTIPDFVISSSVVANTNGGGSVGGSGFEYGVDPNLDPELAMVLRQSAEEEQRRQAALSQGGAEVSGPPRSAPPVTAPAFDDMDEELRLALEISRVEAMATEGSSQVQPAPTTTNDDEEEIRLALRLSKDQEDTDDVFDEAVNNEQFMAEVAKASGLDPSKVLKPKNDKDPNSEQ